MKWQRSDPFLKPVDTWTDVLVLDHLGVPLVRLLAPTRVSPTHLTILGVLLRAVAVVFFVTHAWGWAALCYVAGLIFDGADGKLARLRGTSSRRGAMLDVSADFGLFVALWFSLGLGQGVPTWILLTGSGAGVASALVTAASDEEPVTPSSWGRMLRRPGVLEMHVLVFALSPMLGQPVVGVIMAVAGAYFALAWISKLAMLGGSE